MTQIVFRCPKCKSYNVVRDAFAEWSRPFQAWHLQSTYDNFSCNECGENDIRPIEEDFDQAKEDAGDYDK